MIVSLLEVKSSLMPEMASSADGALLTSLIAEITSQAETYANIYLTYGSYTETFDGKAGSSAVLIKGVNIHSVTSVKFNGIEQNLSFFRADETIGCIISSIGFPDGYSNIEVTYTAGYDTTDHPAPAGLKRAIIDEVIVRYEYLRTQSKTGENIADLKKDFLSGRSERYLKKIRRETLW